MLERLDIYLYTYCEINKDSLRNGTMRIFEIETTNPKSAYADTKQDIALPNPTAADCEGRFPKMFINKPYRVELYNSYGVFVFGDEYE